VLDVYSDTNNITDTKDDGSQSVSQSIKVERGGGSRRISHNAMRIVCRSTGVSKIIAFLSDCSSLTKHIRVKRKIAPAATNWSHLILLFSLRMDLIPMATSKKQEARSKKQEARSKKQEARSKKQEARSKKQEARSKKNVVNNEYPLGT
jgi:hypothetical protein